MCCPWERWSINLSSDESVGNCWGYLWWRLNIQVPARLFVQFSCFFLSLRWLQYVSTLVFVMLLKIYFLLLTNHYIHLCNITFTVAARCSLCSAVEFNFDEFVQLARGPGLIVPANPIQLAQSDTFHTGESTAQAQPSLAVQRFPMVHIRRISTIFFISWTAVNSFETLLLSTKLG